MTGIGRLGVVVFVAMAQPMVLAQQAGQSPAEWQRLHEMGLRQKSGWDLYSALKAAAGGGRQSPPFDQLPDWSGLWTATGGPSLLDPAPGGVTPKLTAAAAAAVKVGAEQAARGITYDENLSQCGPPGFPRWLVIPFLREFIVRPEQTWLSSETVNNVRRIYTDGRGHPPEEDRYPLYYGDSIGFWDGPKLVIHTNQLMTRSMGRNEPEQSDRMETVEVWQKIDARTMAVDVWIYDPAVFLEPWYVRRMFTQVANPDQRLRMRYWYCGENPNNEVYKTPDGNTQFKDFSFSGGGDRTKEQGR